MADVSRQRSTVDYKQNGACSAAAEVANQDQCYGGQQHGTGGFGDAAAAAVRVEVPALVVELPGLLVEDVVDDRAAGVSTLVVQHHLDAFPVG